MRPTSLIKELRDAARIVVDAHTEGKLNPTPGDSVRIECLRGILQELDERDEEERNAESNAP